MATITLDLTDEELTAVRDALLIWYKTIHQLEHLGVKLPESSHQTAQCIDKVLTKVQMLTWIHSNEHSSSEPR